jgi:hypothetical protein
MLVVSFGIFATPSLELDSGRHPFWQLELKRNGIIHGLNHIIRNGHFHDLVSHAHAHSMLVTKFRPFNRLLVRLFSGIALAVGNCAISGFVLDPESREGGFLNAFDLQLHSFGRQNFSAGYKGHPSDCLSGKVELLVDLYTK